MSNRFSKDAAEILLQKFQAGHVDRRGFLTALGALGLGVALRPGTASAAENEIVLCNWGGVAVDAFQQAFGGPFTAKTGMKLVIDGAGPAIGSVRTMVDSGNVIWDVMDNGLIDAQVLSAGNYVEPIDYAITWNQNTLLISAWSVPRGNPAGKKVFEFIKSALDPEPQFTLLRLMGNGPTNPAAEAMMTDEDRVFNPTSPANTKGQVLVNPGWYAEHEADVQNKFLDLIAT